MKLENYLKTEINPEYKKFHEKLCKTKYEILGIKIPVLRKTAKELLNVYELDYLIENIPNNYYEEVLIKGLIIGYSKLTPKELIKYINDFIPLIDNWAICDTFCSTLKTFKNNKEVLYDYVIECINSSYEYKIRFGLVILMSYYLCDEYLDNVYNVLDNVDTSYYYTHMAASWLLSYLFIHYYDKTLNYLKTTKLNNLTINKGITKARESFRVPDDHKIALQKYKR